MKLRVATAAVLLGLTSLTLITGCSRERIDWKSAEAADTQEAYNHFLERHPDSELATQARARLAQLAEDKDWQRAISADTADAYRSFLAQHATGKWAEEARIRMENFTLDSNAAPASAQTDQASAGTPAAPASSAPAAAAREHASSSGPAQAASRSESGSAAHPPTATRSASAPTPGPPSKPAPVAPAPASGSAAPADDASSYGIQLGAFSTQAAALGEWKRLQLKYDSQLHGMFARAVPVKVTSGTLFRLQSPVASEGRAREICSELTKLSQPCVVVLPAPH